MSQNQSRRSTWRRGAVGTIVRGRYTGLTIVLISLSIAVNAIRDAAVRAIVVDLAFTVLLLFAIWTVGPRLRIMAVILAIPTFVGQVTMHDAAPIHRALSLGISAAFLGFLTLVILASVLRNEVVTFDTVIGAVCTYFLMGVTWGNFYTFEAVLFPDAFDIAPKLAAAADWGRHSSPLEPLMQYYSLVTLSGLGTNDLTPISPGARTLTALEGLVGQLYLAVLIARLVGMHVATRVSKH